MKSEIQAVIVIGLCALVSCSHASIELTDLVDVKWLGHSDQIYFVGELVEAQGGESVEQTAGYIGSLRGELQAIYDSLPQQYGEESDQDILARYVAVFRSKIESLVNAKVTARFEELLPKLRISWFDDLRFYLFSLIAIIDEPESSSQCSEVTWTHFVQTINQLYGRDVDAFVAGTPNEYPKFQAFLLHYGKQTLGMCARITHVQQALWLDETDYERRLDALLAKYGNLKRQGRIHNILTDHQLYYLAQQLDLVDGEFDSRRMLASTPTLVGRDAKTTTTFDQFYARFHRSCGSFNAGLGYFNKWLLSNLERLLMRNQHQPGANELSIRERKLMEYSRLFSKFCSVGKERIAANFERNKPRKSQSKCSKFFCGLG